MLKETPTHRLEVSARHHPESMHRLARIITVLVILTLVGVGWFRLVQGWSLLDSSYMTVFRPDDVLIALGKVTAVS